MLFAFNLKKLKIDLNYKNFSNYFEKIKTAHCQGWLHCWFKEKEISQEEIKMLQDLGFNVSRNDWHMEPDRKNFYWFVSWI